MPGLGHAPSKLAARENVIARWRVDPERWKAFVALDNELRAGHGGANWLSPRLEQAAGGEVIIGKHAIQVDGEFEMLDVGDLTGIEWLASPPPALLLKLHISDPNGSNVDKTYRIPIAVRAEPDARRVIDYFNSVMLSAKSGRASRPHNHGSRRNAQP